MRRLRAGLVLVSVAALTLTAAVGARTSEGEDDWMLKHPSVQGGVAGFDKQHGPHFDFECTATSGGANTNLDCDDPFPNNEPDIEVDPANPLHMVASSNDYGSCCDQYYTTFDGGLTWCT